MSKGMWTKQYSPTGKMFYFNASQNLSVWHPPVDSVIHDAPYIKSQTVDVIAVSDTVNGTNNTTGHYAYSDGTNYYNYINTLTSNNQIATDTSYSTNVNSVPVNNLRFE